MTVPLIAWSLEILRLILLIISYINVLVHIKINSNKHCLTHVSHNLYAFLHNLFHEIKYFL